MKQLERWNVPKKHLLYNSYLHEDALMLRNSLHILLLRNLLMAACGQKKSAVITHSEPAKSESEQHFLITSAGDTIPTGVPIPANGKRIDPDTVAKPRSISLKMPLSKRSGSL